MPKGVITGIVRLYTTWQLLYEIDGEQLGIVEFDQRPLARFYERATGRDLNHDYAGGQGLRDVSMHLTGLRISVTGERPTQYVRLERD